MLRIGLTGGVGAGKSTVAERFREHGAVVIDADVIAREVVEPGTEGLAELVEAFGVGVLDARGALNRPVLAEKVFSQEDQRLKLNSILHPRIAARTRELMAAVPESTIVVHDVPLLVENDLGAHYHLTIVVHASEDTRLRRLVQFRGMSEVDARNRILAQASDEQRREAADVWLINEGSHDVVLAQVDRLWSDRLVPFEANIRLRRARTPSPARIAPYDHQWPAQARRAMARLRAASGTGALRIDHIGATAVPGLPARDIIDLQITVSALSNADAFSERLIDSGFLRAEGEWFDEPQDGSSDPWPKRFHYSADPARPINVHVRSTQTPAWRLALLFRDWLRENPDERLAYASVKEELATRYATDVSVDGDTAESYAAAKRQWVNQAFFRAEEWAMRTGWSLRQHD
jgi:dephospho-CoA kinase